MSQLTDTLARAKSDATARRLRPGIRASFIIGIAVMATLTVIVTVAALLTSASMTRGVNSIVQTQLPATLASMRLARAGDALAASGSALMAVRTNEERTRALARVELAQQSLDRILVELELLVGTQGIARIAPLGGEINQNLDRLQAMVDERLEIIEQQRRLRGELQTLLQAFQQQATYRVRIIESDSAVMTMLAQRNDPSLEQIGEIAVRTAPLIPLARFYAQVESVGSRTLGASQDPSLSVLELSEEIINTLMTNASATLSRLPADVASEFEDLYSRLVRLAQSDAGLPSLRRRELALLTQGDAWNQENQHILARLDDVTSTLVDDELSAIYQASDSVSRMNQTNFWILSSVAAIGLMALVMFFYFHILKDLL
ncbi:MAG: hypothetical protein KKD00_10635, partial [Gammaproteobacteria bacterium]|nr:hypothetical protein [Gammaproteobacteria bacterium]